MEMCMEHPWAQSGTDSLVAQGGLFLLDINIVTTLTRAPPSFIRFPPISARCHGREVFEVTQISRYSSSSLLTYG